MSGDLVGARQATPHDTHHVTPHVMRVLEACQQPSTRRELQSALSLLDRVHFHEKYLWPAISAGFLEMTNPEKPASKLQKYRLTPQGLALLHASPERQVTDLSGPESGLESASHPESDFKHSHRTTQSPTPPVTARVDTLRPESGLESRLESATSRKILAALSSNELGRRAIARALGHQRVSGAVNRAIKELLAAGVIEQTIPDKPNSRLQKYRLTQKGRAYLPSKHNANRTG